MPQHFDRLETRPSLARDAALLRDLRAILSMAKARAPALRRQIKGIDLASIKTRADLVRIPVLRTADLRNLQAEEPPFGGLLATRTSALRRLLVAEDSFCVPEGQAKDWWGAGRALCAAGFGKGDIILNCFSYHLAPEGFVMDSGAQALGCAVIPTGEADPELQLATIRRLKPTAYCGPLDNLLALIARAEQCATDLKPIARALVAGTPLSSQSRREIERRGLSVKQAYVVPHVGVIAYETQSPDGEVNDGLIVNEGIILEIVVPGTSEPVPEGEIGEVVITRLNPDYPLLRYGTGHLAALLSGRSPCGRTNMRIRRCLGPIAESPFVIGWPVAASPTLGLAEGSF